MIEKRKEKRYHVRENVLVVMPDIIGQVKNISEGGLAFRYIERDKEIAEPSEMDLFISKDQLYIEKLPIITRFDFARESESPFSVISIRQRGVQFGSLSQVQHNILRHVIKHYAETEPSSL